MKRIIFLIGVFFSSQLYALTTEEFIMKMNISTVGAMIDFDAKNDPNNQLGRPNQYLQKASWADTRIDPHDFSEEMRMRLISLIQPNIKVGRLKSLKMLLI